MFITQPTLLSPVKHSVDELSIVVIVASMACDQRREPRYSYVAHRVVLCYSFSQVYAPSRTTKPHQDHRWVVQQIWRPAKELCLPP